MTSSSILLNVVFGIIGAGYMYSGKRKENLRLIVCGLILGVFPYFVEQTWLILLVGAVVTAFPIIFRGE